MIISAGHFAKDKAMNHDEQIQTMQRFIRDHGGEAEAEDDSELPAKIVVAAIETIEALEKRLEALERR